MTYREVLADLLREYREDWQDDASCRDVDPGIFFPERGQSTREAKRVCAGCPVRIECLTFALTNNERFGVWGGLSDTERRKVRRKEQMPIETAVEDSEETA